MFTLNIRDIVAVGKSEMKWDLDAQNAPTITSEQKAAEQAIKDIQDYKSNDKIVLARLMRTLHSANEDFAKKNSEKSTAIVATFATAITNETDPTKKQILEELQKERAEKVQTKDTAKSNIIDATQTATVAAVPAIAPVVSQNNALKPGTRASASQMITSQSDIST